MCVCSEWRFWIMCVPSKEVEELYQSKHAKANLCISQLEISPIIQIFKYSNLTSSFVCFGFGNLRLFALCVSVCCYSMFRFPLTFSVCSTLLCIYLDLSHYSVFLILHIHLLLFLFLHLLFLFLLLLRTNPALRSHVICQTGLWS